MNESKAKVYRRFEIKTVKRVASATFRFKLTLTKIITFSSDLSKNLITV